MKAWTLEAITKFTDGALTGADAACGDRITRVVFDSRLASPGCLFVPIIGERVDGHDFISDAAHRGAIATLASTTWLAKKPQPSIAVVAVDLPVTALQRWAQRYLATIEPTIVGITGSTGKTTTKEMVAAVLQSKYRVLKNEGNLNTEIGLPLTVLRAEAEHEMLVLEMGMSGLGEITLLTQLAQPDIAVITNVGEAHIELLGSKELIAQAKGEVLAGMCKAGTAILNGDDAHVLSQLHLAPARVIYFGLGPRSDQAERLFVTDLHSSGAGIELVINWQNERQALSFPWPGRHNAYNIAAAVAVGIASGLSLQAAVGGLSNYVPAASRLALKNVADYMIIDDTYNANPTSMEVALNVLLEYPQAVRRIAVLGDMLELGAMATAAHTELGKSVAQSGIDELVTVGRLARDIAHGALIAGMAPSKIHSFACNQTAADYLQAQQTAGQVVLIKGSRGMVMEEIVAALAAHGNEHDD